MTALMTTRYIDPLATPCSALAIFGVTGDLARKKLFASLYELEVLGQLDMPVVGIGRSPWSAEKLREVADTSIRSRPKDQQALDERAREKTLSCLDYIQGSYDSAALYRAITEKVGNHENILCYLAVPPETFPKIIEGLGNSSIRSNVRLLIEKPFGSDRQSASALYELVMNYFIPDQLFAVDHYLQKESLQNLLVLRFAADVSLPGEIRRRREAACFIEDALNVARHREGLLRRESAGRCETMLHAATSETFSPNAIGVGASDALPPFAPTPMALGLNVEMSHSGPRGVYTARAGRTYQYRIVPTYGTPKLLTLEGVQSSIGGPFPVPSPLALEGRGLG